MSAPIDGEFTQFESIADVEKLPKEKALKIVEYLLFVERPNLLLQVSSIPQFQETIKKLQEERDFFFKYSQSIEDLSANIVQYRIENEFLRQKIRTLESSVDCMNQQYIEVSQKLATVAARLDMIQPTSARQIASDADKAALKAIFPEGCQKPYYLRSYNNLLSFLVKPDSDEFTGPRAPAAWLELTEEKRAKIRARADQLSKDHPHLKISIKILKNEAWKQAQGTFTVEETLRFYREHDDDQVCDAISACATFLGLRITKEESSEIDNT